MASKSLAYRWKKVCVRSGDMSIYHLGIVAQNALERRDRKILKNATQLPLRAFQIDVTLEAARSAHRQAGMCGVNLPRMNVKHHRPALAQHLARHLANQPIGKQPQISASEEAHRLAHQVGNCDGDL